MSELSSSYTYNSLEVEAFCLCSELALPSGLIARELKQAIQRKCLRERRENLGVANAGIRRTAHFGIASIHWSWRGRRRSGRMMYWWMRVEWDLPAIPIPQNSHSRSLQVRDPPLSEPTLGERYPDEELPHVGVWWNVV